MGTIVLVRHGRSSANNAGILAGRTAGVDLDATGRAQAEALVERLRECRLSAIVSSPIARCRRTVGPLARATGLDVTVDERFTEVDYGRWSGRPLADLTGEPLWRTVQVQPSRAAFPEGEPLAAASVRAAAAARAYAAMLDRNSGDDAPGAVSAAPNTGAADSAGIAKGPKGAVLICTHGDIIKAILADALGMHLDLFQRISVGPASVSVVTYTAVRPLVTLVGDTGSLAGVGGAPHQPAAGDAVIGGDTGADAT